MLGCRGQFRELGISRRAVLSDGVEAPDPQEAAGAPILSRSSFRPGDDHQIRLAGRWFGAHRAEEVLRGISGCYASTRSTVSVSPADQHRDACPFRHPGTPGSRVFFSISISASSSVIGLTLLVAVDAVNMASGSPSASRFRWKARPPPPD